eukprot:CAMPEP_0115867402 /NCGR_PEP_ID=MMETSP0287-20121206/20750_1 /TAXON_ID=412157 /ORGANISM="Chrysochromulina rotalis, Strain UIO044" /LENGTH=269 /DNA_ID=CAMNT_0003322007 /DNA_START=63 /DNA_END=872 /DNA_ORIENTATION=+
MRMPIVTRISQAATRRVAAMPLMLAKKQDGYYRRPSAALEQGGSFYVPGLEGTRLRTSGAAVLSLGLLLNRVLSPGEPVSSQLVSEALGILGCLIIFAQSFAQNRIDREAEQDGLRSAFAARLKERQDIDPSLSTRSADRVRWASSTLIKVTPARAMIWVGADGRVLARCGRFPDSSGDDVASNNTNSAALLSLVGIDDYEGALTTASFNVDEALSPPAPLPRNAASALVCCLGKDKGVVAIASEQPFAFSERNGRMLQDCVRLLALAS